MTALTLTTEGEAQVIVSRSFRASPADLFRAHTEPALLQRWMLGPAGWAMPVCRSDAQPGGKMRFEWRGTQGGSFSLTGEFIDLVPPHRIVHVERMHLPDPTPDNHVETWFEPEGTGTLLRMVMTLPDAATRKAMLDSGMEAGMEESYARIDPIFGH